MAANLKPILPLESRIAALCSVLVYEHPDWTDEQRMNYALDILLRRHDERLSQ